MCLISGYIIRFIIITLILVLPTNLCLHAGRKFVRQQGTTVGKSQTARRLEMKVILAVSYIAAFCIFFDEGALVSDLKEKTQKYRDEIEILYKFLAKDCNLNREIVKRTNLEAEIEHSVLEKLRGELRKELLQCKKQTKAINPSTTPTTVLTTTKSPSTSTTTAYRVPKECQQARNYTALWRRDYKGLHIRPRYFNKYMCDLSRTEWFRFAGTAGNRMLNSCPEKYSCGTEYPYWTDEKMPSTIGVETIVNVYKVDEETNLIYRWIKTKKCKSQTRKLKVMRCSGKPHDLIYKTTVFVNDCSEAFCGMK